MLFNILPIKYLFELVNFIFVGNRFYVLKKMLECGICLEKIFVVKGSFLEKELVTKLTELGKLEF